MLYEKLSKLFYKLNSTDFDNEVVKRMESYGAIKTSLSIQAFRKGKLDGQHFELFYVMIPELIRLNNEIYRNSGKILALINKLPKFAVEPYFHRLIINEAQSNNEIEGVRSTKKELSQVLQRLEEPESKFKRFNGMMKTYLHIDQIEPIQKVEDFRKLYDQLVADEIAERNEPDGKLFRKEEVRITDGSKITHIGLQTEEKIERNLQHLIVFLQNEEHPELFRYLIAHYYYEYIHPFYDGNGRTGRLLVGSYLARNLDRYSAVTFSYGVNKSKSVYYKALEEVPSPFNKGELTFFLMDMLKILAAGQNEIIEDLEVNEAKLDRITTFLNQDVWENRQSDKLVLRYMIVITVFTSSDRIEVVQMMAATGLSRYMMNNILDTLCEKGMLVLQKARPKSYSVSPDFLEEILQSA